MNGNLQLRLHDLQTDSSDDSLALRIDAIPEPGANVTVVPLELVHVQRATDLAGQTLAVEKHHKPENSVQIINDNGVLMIQNVNGGRIVVKGGGQAQIVMGQGGKQNIVFTGKNVTVEKQLAKPNEVPMCTLSGFQSGSTTIGELRGSLRVRMSRPNMVLQELDAGNRALQVGDSTQSGRFQLKVTEFNQRRNEYQIKLELVYRSSDVSFNPRLQSTPKVPRRGVPKLGEPVLWFLCKRLVANRLRNGM